MSMKYFKLSDWLIGFICVSLIEKEQWEKIVQKQIQIFLTIDKTF